MTQQDDQITTREEEACAAPQLREGFTTGACAAAAAKAAVLGLSGDVKAPISVLVPFPSGESIPFQVEWSKREHDSALAAVRKDAGDDPDVTHGALVVARVCWCSESGIRFEAGEGVGRVTKPGLAIPPGEPAINPGPRKMITAAIRSVTEKGVCVTLSIPGGEELAQKTFNPRLGIVGGLSILGTTGRVRPFSCQAIRCSVACELSVAQAAGVIHPVFVPGHIGEHSARRQLKVTDDQLIEVGNEWGFVLEDIAKYGFEHVLLWGHPGKLAKLAAGEWDTHSSRSGSAIEFIQDFFQGGADIDASLPCQARALPDTAVSVCGADGQGGADIPVCGADSQGGADIDASLPCQARALPDTAVSVCASAALTAEGFFAQLEEPARTRAAIRLSQVIADAAYAKCEGVCRISVALVNLAGDLLGSTGELNKWR